MPYEAFKHIHFTVIGASIALFILRFIWVMKGSEMMQKKWVKIVPHIVDTLLILSGIALIYVTGFTPTNSPWLFEKLIALVAYIVLGFFTLKLERGKLFRTFAFLGALGWLFYMAKLAQTKMPILFM
ncbi:SirB2 family protein [Ferrimonas lipolytica]|uniref:SirB2 family protein n=1 Tax=Ferrimonas lipolytica TaxID=2724191 RepID=A0A6H1UFI3_9GAMM|nr:SirB2 family protein [Ferrimonas lipolytica]QIZ77083.1 SirB2 family protein [Ferrimonas lipolytica]